MSERQRILSSVSFGAPAAERDIREGLEDYFVESQAFERVFNGKKRLVLGNRGSGKSAILKMVGQRAKQKKVLVIELSPEDYSYEMLSKVMLEEDKGAWAKSGAYTVAWRFMIYVLAFKALTSKGGRFRTGPGLKIYNYLRDNHKNTDTNPMGHLISYVKRLEGVKLGKLGEVALTKSRELESLYRLEEVDHLLPHFDELLSNQEVYVLIDELDRGWDASEDARTFVAGLVQASNKLNERHEGLRVYVSLRRELYDNIPELYQDAQKNRDLTETIEWDEDALYKVAARRIKHSAVSLSTSTDDQAWNFVFSEILQYRGTRSFNYMIDRTLYRPREIIELCNTVVEKAQAAKWEPPLDYPAIQEAERIYSGERAKDIASEYRFQFPGLISVFEQFRGMVYAFDRDELETLMFEMIVGDRKVSGCDTWLPSMEPDHLIAVLWQVGFLRAQAVGGIKGRQRSGSTYLGSHQIESLDLGNLRRFDVHHMFRSWLGMREPKRRT